MKRYWYPVMTRWSDQTGVAHLLADGPVAKPLCKAKAYNLGGGFERAEDAGCHPCLRCLKIAESQDKKRRKRESK
jgi:hypothetical protein